MTICQIWVHSLLCGSIICIIFYGYVRKQYLYKNCIVSTFPNCSLIHWKSLLWWLQFLILPLNSLAPEICHCFNYIYCHILFDINYLKFDIDSLYVFHIASKNLGGSDTKQSAHGVGDLGLIPGSKDPLGEGNGYPIQYSGLGNPMERGTRWATVHGVTKSHTRLSD